MGFVLVPPDQKKVDGEARRVPRRVGQGAVPGAGQRADRGLAGPLQAATPKLKGLTLDDVQRDKLNEDGDRHGIVVDPVNRMLYEFYRLKKTDAGLAGGVRGDLRPEVEQAAAGRVDLRRRGRAADLPGGRALRRAEARHGRARDARDGPADAAGVRLPGDALRQPADRREPAADGRAAPAAEGLRHVELLAGGAGDPGGAEEVRHVRGRQRHRVGDLGGPGRADPGPARGAAEGEGVGLRGRHPAAGVQAAGVADCREAPSFSDAHRRDGRGLSVFASSVRDVLPPGGLGNVARLRRAWTS